MGYGVIVRINGRVQVGVRRRDQEKVFCLQFLRMFKKFWKILKFSLRCLFGMKSEKMQIKKLWFFGRLQTFCFALNRMVEWVAFYSFRCELQVFFFTEVSGQDFVGVRFRFVRVSFLLYLFQIWVFDLVWVVFFEFGFWCIRCCECGFGLCFVFDLGIMGYFVWVI